MEFSAEIQEARESVASFMKRLHDRGLTTPCGGNVSARVGDRVAITPSSLDKASLTGDVIAVLDLESGENLTPHLRTSIEAGMHLAVYRARADVMAVCHAHPLYSSLFSALENPVDTSLIAETSYLLGPVVKAPFAMMGSAELADVVARCVVGADCLLLENHGALTTGKSLLLAYERMEVLENAAKMTWMRLNASEGIVFTPLDEERLKALEVFR